jgi:hypothetical protein
MGIFSSPNPRFYVPPVGRDSDRRGTLLGGHSPEGDDWLTLLTRQRQEEGGRDPNVVLAKAGPAAAEVQIAQQRPTPPRPRRPSPPSNAELMSQPGRGYGQVAQDEIERDASTGQPMTQAQKAINRGQALREIARLPVPSDPRITPLPDGWERTKPSEIVDDIKRAAQRHGVPIQLFARLLYQEGKFNEPGRVHPPIVWSSPNARQPLGLAQMTTETLNELKRLARTRGDTARARELDGFSLADRAQAFDAAAEHLAYQHRLLGSWHAAVAGYNRGHSWMAHWLTGLEPNKDFRAPEGSQASWNQMTNYLRIIFRGAAEDAQTADMYEPGNVRTGVRVAPQVPRSRNQADAWRIPSDTRRNP